MKYLRLIPLVPICLLATCTDYATFVTATNIGISADTTTRDLSIGYTRAELFTGPGYPEQGEAPQAAGYIGSNLSAFTPKIQQLYATGDAAGLATQDTDPPEGPELPKPFTGPRRPLVFGTGTNVGLKIGFAGGATPAPSSMKFGYNREELSIIPLQQGDPNRGTPDKYAPVLAAINLDTSVGSNPSDASLKLTQFFATGAPARNLAKRQDIRNAFKGQAAQEAEKATLAEWETALTAEAAKIKAYLEKGGGYNTTNRDALLRATGRYDELPSDLKSALTEDAFFKALDRYFMLTHPLAEAAGR
jgi:hypothetical protein